MLNFYNNRTKLMFHQTVVEFPKHSNWCLIRHGCWIFKTMKLKRFLKTRLLNFDSLNWQPKLTTKLMFYQACLFHFSYKLIKVILSDKVVKLLGQLNWKCLIRISQTQIEFLKHQNWRNSIRPGCWISQRTQLERFYRRRGCWIFVTTKLMFY